MKKLLVLFVVLGMASMASAALSLQVVGGSGAVGTLDWTVSGMELIGSAAAVPAGPYGGTVGLTGANANNTAITPGRPGDGMPTRLVDFGNPVETYVVRNAGLGSIAWDGVYASYALGAIDGPAPQLRAAGEWFVFDINLPEGTLLTAEFWGDENGYAEPLGSMDLEVVPEPMTMALLGLGGLGLLRRRRS